MKHTNTVHTFKIGNTTIINGKWEYPAAINSENPVITQWQINDSETAERKKDFLSWFSKDLESQGFPLP